MCDLGENPARVYERLIRKARRPHWCCECAGPVPIGHRYVFVHGIWEGGPEDFHFHLECDALWDFCVHELCGDEGGRTLSGLAQEIADYAYRDAVEGEIAECGTDLFGILTAIRAGYELAASPTCEQRA